MKQAILMLLFCLPMVLDQQIPIQLRKDPERLLMQDDIIIFDTPQNIIFEPSYITLHWKSKAKFCLITGPQKFIVPQEGIKEVYVSQDSVFFIECYNKDGKVGTKTNITISVDPFKNYQRIQVGPNRLYKTISQAITQLSSQTVIQLDQGIYRCSKGTNINKDNIKIIGVGRRVILDETGCDDGSYFSGWSMLAVTGTNFYLQNIRFIGVKNTDRSASAVRFMGKGIMYIKNCSIFDSHNGIIGLPQPDIQSKIIIQNCQFAFIGDYSQLHHMIQVFNTNTLLIKGSYLHHGIGGYYIKSVTSTTNYILYNRLADEQTGFTFHNIYLHTIQQLFMLGNILHKGSYSQNQAIMSIYGSQNPTGKDTRIVICSNTVINDILSPFNIFVNHYPTSSSALTAHFSYITNNIVYGVTQFRYYINQKPQFYLKLDIGNNYHANQTEFISYQQGDYTIVTSVKSYHYNIFDETLINPQLKFNFKANTKVNNKYIGIRGVQQNALAPISVNLTVENLTNGNIRVSWNASNANFCQYYNEWTYNLLPSGSQIASIITTPLQIVLVCYSERNRGIKRYEYK